MIKQNRFATIIIIATYTLIIGCSSLLPKEKNLTVGTWDTYEEAENAFEEIKPYTTTLKDLNELNIDPDNNKNITILNYVDIANQFSATVEGYTLDKGVGECIIAKSKCRGYQITERVLKSNRYGNFFSDLLNFKRKTDTVGWEFNGIILLKNEIVIYTLTSGIPAIHEKTETHRPLGPLQSGKILVDVAEKNY